MGGSQLNMVTLAQNLEGDQKTQAPFLKYGTEVLVPFKMSPPAHSMACIYEQTLDCHQPPTVKHQSKKVP